MKLIRCECGFVARGDSDDQVVGMIRGHMAADHPTLLEAVSREDLVRNVLSREFSPFDRSIDTHVCNLRRKLGPLPDGGERIKVVRGAGYLYVSPTKPGAW